jgi:hypothetical protein
LPGESDGQSKSEEKEQSSCPAAEHKRQFSKYRWDFAVSNFDAIFCADGTGNRELLVQKREPEQIVAKREIF